MTDMPTIKIRTGEGAERALTPINSALFTFAGELASRNHIFTYEPGTESGTTLGSYIFSIGTTEFSNAVEFMISHGFVCHLNVREVPECDETAFQNVIDQAVTLTDIPTFVPDNLA